MPSRVLTFMLVVACGWLGVGILLYVWTALLAGPSRVLTRREQWLIFLYYLGLGPIMFRYLIEAAVDMRRERRARANGWPG